MKQVVGFLFISVLLLSGCGSDSSGSFVCDEIYSMAREMPVIQGGLAAVQEQIRYPEEALERNIEGTVEVSFTVNKRGEVLNPRVTKGLGYGIDEEAVRVMKLAKFKPASQSPGGDPVCVEFELPLNFIIPQD